MNNDERQAGTEAQTPTEAEVTQSAQLAAITVLPACGGEEEEDDEDIYDQCLNCQSTWGPGSEEHDFQQCDACGWMPGEPTDEDLPDDDNDDELDYEPVS